MERIELAEFAGWLEKPVKPEDLVRDLEPPRHFRNATFQNYQVDRKYPSQQTTVAEVERFSEGKPGATFLERIFKRSRAEGSGLYLDGGFGVGKTHLLASAYHRHHGKKSFLSFQELMFLVGLKGLNNTAEFFSHNSLLVIDEFELDDPANTRIATNILGQLLDRGVRILTSSNTAPGSLGEGKFSVEAFRREMGELFSRFQSIRIDGDDYRKTHHPGNREQRHWLPVGSIPEVRGKRFMEAEFQAFLRTLALAHPIRVRKALPRLDAVHLKNITTISDPHAALRFVYFIDKVYDDNIGFSASSSVGITELFSRSIFHGGDTKKYLRAMSRIEELVS